MPHVLQVILLTATVLCAIPAYLVVIVPERCYVAFSVSDRIADKLDGNVSNMMKDLGWVCLGTSLVGCALFKVFSTWITCTARGQSAFTSPPSNPTVVFTDQQKIGMKVLV